MYWREQIAPAEQSKPGVGIQPGFGVAMSGTSFRQDLQGEALTVTSSRIIVKNLPKNIAESRLRQHFGAKGTITDVKLMYSREGIFRRFAYVGFTCPAEAAAAIAYYDRTFVDTSRIEVQPAKAVGDPSIPRAWSRHSAGSSSHTATAERLEREAEAKRAAAAEKAKADLERKRAFLSAIYDAEQQDPDLAKYLGAAKPKSKTKTWENDDETLASVMPVPTGKKQKMGEKRKNKSVHVDVKAIPNKKPGGEGLMVAKTHVTYSDSGDDRQNNAPVDEGSSDDELYEDFAPGQQQHSMVAVRPEDTDTEDFIDSDTRALVYPDPAETEHAATMDTAAVSKYKELKPELISETGRLFVRNLAFSCTSEDISRLFEQYGPVTEVHLSLSKETKRPKGYAYVQFVQPEAALRAYRGLDGGIFQGRLLHVLPSEAKPAAKPQTSSASELSFKQKKAEQQKTAAGDDFNWNSLFVRSDTVLESIASQLGVCKADLMNPKTESLAVRLATAETHLIADTKAALESEGVDPAVFMAPGKPSRSDRVIIVKNLPFDTDKAELNKLFSKHGPLGRVILPTSKAIAIVEFLESADAKVAFRTLAYSKFHNVPLFLEWAPAGILKSEQQRTSEPMIATPATVVADSVIVTDNAAEVDGTDSRTLYVKNINFDTQEETLRTLFASEVGPVKSVTIPRKRNPRKPDAGLLSMGFAFVTFDRPEHVTLAIDRLQGRLIDNHAVVLKRSCAPVQQPLASQKRNMKKTGEDEGNAKGTRLLVRNVPFEASEKEVRELFKAFASVKRVRLPKKFDGGHRGFAFVEFVNNQEARGAKAALAHTHLYGRHLVLEWAKEDTSTTELRDKSARNAQLLSATEHHADFVVGQDRDVADITLDGSEEDD